MKRAFLKRHTFALGLALAAANVAAIAVACSSSQPDLGAEPDGATGDGGVTPLGDAKVDSPTTQPDTGKPGNCSAVKGPCDIVAQDCPPDAKGKRQECVTTGSGSGKPTTECIPEQASQIVQMGAACCPPTQAQPDNPCLPGLTCVGQPCTDGGAPSGRCTPACCEGDDISCGKSEPEGIAGACDVMLVAEGNVELHGICSYRERCKPFKEEPCKPGQTCLIQDKTGSASCLTSFNKTRGEKCSFANECADGYMCVGGADAGVCRMMCLTPNSTHPFDAGIEDGGPLRGGCPANEKCILTFDPQSAPAWLSLCAFPDGG